MTATPTKAPKTPGLKLATAASKTKAPAMSPFDALGQLENVKFDLLELSAGLEGMYRLILDGGHHALGMDSYHCARIGGLLMPVQRELQRQTELLCTAYSVLWAAK